MPHNEQTSPSTEPVLLMVRGELTSKRRWLYRLLLLAISGVLAMLLYQRNRFPRLDGQELALLRSEWKRTFEEWGYSLP